MIIVYLGKWPKWFHLFLESCKRNTNVNFLIFTDQVVTRDNFKNIEFFRFSLAHFNALASLKLNLQIEINDPYKICDLRSAFGVIFDDYLKNYSFWGYTDIDLIFGEIGHYINDDLLDNYEVLTARKEYLVGHFTLYRNREDVNCIYKFCENYDEIFMSKDYHGFDECNFLWWDLIAGQNILSMPTKGVSMTHLVMNLAAQEKIRALFRPLVLEQDHRGVPFNRLLLWENGKLSDDETKEDFLYFHFHYLKKTSEFYCPEWDTIPNKFFISNDGFSM